jgi:hypothetical protein
LPYPGPVLSFVTVRREGDVLGGVMMQHRESPSIPRDLLPAEFHPVTICRAELDLIETLAGPAAEVRQRQGRFGLLLAEDTVIRETLAVDPQAGSDDVHRARQSLDWIAPPDPARALRELWRRAVRLTQIEFPRIVAVARLLCAAAEIEGEAFETAWRGCRPSEAVRPRRARGLELPRLADPGRLRHARDVADHRASRTLYRRYSVGDDLDVIRKLAAENNYRAENFDRLWGSLSPRWR